MFLLSLNCVLESTTSGRSYYNSPNNCVLEGCSFYRSSVFSSNGAVILISGTDSVLSISKCMFNNVYSSGGHGGAISFSGVESSIKQTCAHQCDCGTSYGHFAYIIVSSGLNVFEMDSVTKCTTRFSGACPINTIGGNQANNALNMSKNIVDFVSGITISSPNSLNCTHCTFYSNLVKSLVCIDLIGGTSNNLLTFCNVIENNSPTYGVFYIRNSPYKIQYSIINQNTGTLFVIDSGSAEVMDSAISHGGVLKSGLFSTNNNVSLIQLPSLHLVHYSTYLCPGNSGIGFVSGSRKSPSNNVFFIFTLILQFL